MGGPIAEALVATAAGLAAAIPAVLFYNYLAGRVKLFASEEVLVHALADLGHGPGKLVTHHQRRGAVAHPAKVAFDLGAADPHRGHRDPVGVEDLRADEVEASATIQLRRQGPPGSRLASQSRPT